jgi:DNA-binding NtrC family response regulator
MILISHRVAGAAMSNSIQTTTMLILHDEAPASEELNTAVSGAGHANVATFHNRGILKLWLESFTPSLAILDAAAEHGECLEILAILAQRQVPVVILYRDEPPGPDAEPVFRDIEWITVEASPQAILAAVERAVQKIETKTGALASSEIDINVGESQLDG